MVPAMKVKCVAGLKHCDGPYVKTCSEVCLDCAIHHDEHPDARCPCNDCLAARGALPEESASLVDGRVTGDHFLPKFYQGRFNAITHERLMRLEDTLTKLFDVLGSDLVARTLGLRDGVGVMDLRDGVGVADP